MTAEGQMADGGFRLSARFCSLRLHFSTDSAEQHEQQQQNVTPHRASMYADTDAHFGRYFGFHAITAGYFEA